MIPPLMKVDISIIARLSDNVNLPRCAGEGEWHAKNLPGNRGGWEKHYLVSGSRWVARRRMNPISPIKPTIAVMIAMVRQRLVRSLR